MCKEERKEGAALRTHFPTEVADGEPTKYSFDIWRNFFLEKRVLFNVRFGQDLAVVHVLGGNKM